jgi:2-keto-3-deoxy-6-phosphogluconate aldolase
MQRRPELLLSVGTIKTATTAKESIKAGADFIICRGVIPAVADGTILNQLSNEQ